MENGMEIRRLRAEDYDQALDFLNMVFSMANRPHDFLQALPRMWARDDEHMGMCEGFTSAPPCLFYLRSWDQLTDALLMLRRRLTPMPSGEAVIGIDGWGALKIEVCGRNTAAARTEEAPEIMLRPDEAAQLMFGFAPNRCADGLSEETAALFAAWFPLPLSWCTLDRV